MDWITFENVIVVADQLMNMGEDAMKKAYQFERDSWVFNLSEALSQYIQWSQSPTPLLNARTTLETLSSPPHQEVMEYYLCALLEYTKAFAQLLTVEAKEKLKVIALKAQTEAGIPSY